MSGEEGSIRRCSDGGNGNAFLRAMNLKDLNYALNSTLEKDGARREKRNAAPRSEISVNARRESSRIANLSEGQREKRKMVQNACYSNRKRRRAEEEISNVDNGVNVDAERFRAAFDLTTQFYVCGVCGPQMQTIPG